MDRKLRSVDCMNDDVGAAGNTETRGPFRNKDAGTPESGRCRKRFRDAV